jgi:hypothetical protein
MRAARCVAGSYSSGYCPGVAPGSLFIRPTFINRAEPQHVQFVTAKVQLILNTTIQNDDFVAAMRKGKQIQLLASGKKGIGVEAASIFRFFFFSCTHAPTSDRLKTGAVNFFQG